MKNLIFSIFCLMLVSVTALSKVYSNADSSLIAIKYIANECFRIPHKSLSRSQGFFLMQDGSVVTSQQTRFVGPFKDIQDFIKTKSACTYDHGKMGDGKKDYRIIDDDQLFNRNTISKFVSGGGGDFAGGGATGYWIGEPIVTAAAPAALNR